MRIPDYTLRGLVNYVENGCPTGGFLYAVLTNDLFGAIGQADQENRPALQEIVQWLYWVPPGGCKGSVDRVQAWLEMAPDQRADILALCPSWQEFKQENTAPGVDSEDGVPGGNKPAQEMVHPGV